MAQRGPYDGTTVRVSYIATGAAICEGIVIQHVASGDGAIEVQDKHTGTTSWFYAQETGEVRWYAPGWGAPEVTIYPLALSPALPPRCCCGHGPMQHIAGPRHSKYGRDVYRCESCGLECEVPY